MKTNLLLLAFLTVSSVFAAEPEALTRARESSEAEHQKIADKYAVWLRASIDKAMEKKNLDEVNAYQAELALVSKSIHASAKMDIGRERREKAVLAANNPGGYILKDVRKGTKITFRYESGVWKAWGRIPTCNPDVAEIEGGDLSRVTIAKTGEDGSVGSVLAVVPPGTSSQAFTFVASEDYPYLALRIMGKNNVFDGPGSVEYSLAIATPVSAKDSCKVVSFAKKAPVPASANPATQPGSATPSGAKESPFGRHDN